MSKNNNLLYLSALAFLLISTSAISMTSGFEEVIKYVSTPKITKAYADLPILTSDARYPILSAQSVMAVDMDSGVTLYEKDPNKALLPASTTKIMTALVAIDAYQENQVLKVGKVTVEGQKMGLVTGEEIKFRDLLNGLLIYSANDAAEVLAINYPLGRDEFINKMNEKAKELKLTNTHFSNPAGLDNGAQYSTTRDLIVLAKYAMKNPGFAEIVGTKEKTVASIDNKIVHRLHNTNELLGKTQGVLGVKTGWTENARENLVTYVERDGRKVITVVLGSSDRFGETEELINWIYSNYTWTKVTPRSSQ